MTPLRQRMIEQLQLRNLSEATINTYVRAVWRFTKYFGKSPEQLGPEQVREYLVHLLNDKDDAWTTIQVNRGALKFLYFRVQSRDGSTRRSLLPRSGRLPSR
jgi:integrase/recombinase XerD